MSATTQQFFLRWNNYVNHLTYAFDSLRTQEDLVDVTLSCEGRKIRAHKVILSACSTYFREVFQENPCQHPVIVFKNVRYEDLTAIIEFIYQGEVNVVQESLPSFLHTAELLSVQGLTEGAAGGEKEEREAPVAKSYVTTPVTKVQTPIVTRMVATSGSSREVARLPPKSTTLTTVTTEAPSAKRKRFYIDSDDNIAIEGINFVKQSPDTITIENANVEFTPMKIDIPDYIDISTAADEENAGVAEEVLMDERTDDTTGGIEDEGGESQEDQDLTETDTTPQILAVRSGSEDVEQTYRVEAVDSSDISTDFNQSKYSGDSTKPDEKSLQQDSSNTKWSQCQFCKLVITTVNLWRHVRTQHTSQPPRKCEHCQKSFKNKYSLREHIRIAHEYKNTSQTEVKTESK